MSNPIFVGGQNNECNFLLITVITTIVVPDLKILKIQIGVM